MKVNYFGYCLSSDSQDIKVRYDLRDMLKAFCRYAGPDFKNRFIHNDEHLYLIHHVGDVFYFLTTRSTELVKRVNTASISVEEIESLLEQDEQLGFSSYLILKEDHFGFAATIFAPKIDTFASYINNLFEALGIFQWKFVPRALLYQATRAEALGFSHVGRTTIELSKENSFVQDMLATVMADTTDSVELEGVEIVLKPKLRRNIKPTVEKFLDKIPDDGVERMIIKAKEEAGSMMSDLYLVGQGAISDKIDKTNEIRIPSLLESKISENRILQEKLAEYRSNDTFEEITPDAVVRFVNADTWAHLLRDLLQDSGSDTGMVTQPPGAEE